MTEPTQQQAPPKPLQKPVPRFDAKKSFTGARAIDRAKAYLNEVPVIRARMVKAVTEQEEAVKSFKSVLERFEVATKDIEVFVKKLEDDKSDDGTNTPDAGDSADEVQPTE